MLSERRDAWAIAARAQLRWSRKRQKEAIRRTLLPPPVQRVHVKISSLEDSARVVEDATGKRPSTELETEKFADLRLTRTRQFARSVFHWNKALNGLTEQVVRQPELTQDLEELLTLAGFGGNRAERSTMPDAIAQYSQWSVDEVTPVSKHSAVWRLSSTDRKRGTPHPRGRGVLPTPKTWHVTLLGEIGRNDEGPLPWIERDYTPVSSAKEWEAGQCALLIKVYPDGAATSWLHRVSPARVWLSKPVQTLAMPGLMPSGQPGFIPKSVLLLLAGTGVVALPQILHHRDPIHKLGIGTPQASRLPVPIDVVLSFRDDDVLYLPKIAEYCREGESAARTGESRGVRNCTLLLTAANSDHAVFPDCGELGDGRAAEHELDGLDNARVLRGERLSSTVVDEAVARMPQPCRIVVSGPGGFNAAARAMLELSVDSNQITVLSA
eukprot:COSAG02_NODE_219_length_28538_cov_79.322058_25_plen_439_part_00